MSTEILQEISPDKIVPNPENPRFIFREKELNQLLDSIEEVGIKVPLSVFRDNKKYTLIDGERRWRCARKLNLPTVPVIVYPKPSPLENLLMMFNIHNVRLDWDIMPMALKLKQISEMLAEDGKDNKPKSLAAITGVSLTTVKRAFELLNLPEKYQKLLLEEAAKPKNQQRVTPDVFIEVNNSQHVVERYVPKVFKKVDKDQYVDAMVEKYMHKVINNVVKFRDVAKIARAELAGVDQNEAARAIVKLVKDKNYTIEQAYQDTVEAAYIQRDLASRLKTITDKLTTFESERLTDEVRSNLLFLRSEIDRLLDE